MNEQTEVAEKEVETKAEPSPSEITMGKIEALGAEMEKAETKVEPSVKDAAPTAKAEPKAEPGVKAEEKAAETTPVDEDADELVPPEKRDNSWYARQRRKYKEERDKRIALEARISEIEKRETPSAQADPQNTARNKKQPDVRASDVFRVYAKAKAGEFAGNLEMGLSADEQNVRVLQSSRDAIEREFSVSDLREAINDANKGLFGVYSDEIASVARQALPLALSREMSNQEEVQKYRQDQEQETAKRIEELRQTVEKHPEFKDSNNPIYKHVEPWMKKWIGESDSAGRITKPGLLAPQVSQFILQHPLVQAELVKQDFYSIQFTSTLSEKQRLETEINKLRQPESGGHPAGSSSEPTGSAATKAKLEAEFGPVD